MDRPYPEDQSALSPAERKLADDHPYVLSARSEEGSARFETRRMFLGYAIAGTATAVGLTTFGWSQYLAEKYPVRGRR